MAPRRSLKQSFDKTMERTRNSLPLPQRLFSKLMHLPAVEKTSDVLGSTVARPDAILSGSVFAFLATGALYLFAKYYGFALSGSETMASFAAGWILGIIFDVLRSAISRRR